MNLPYPYRTKWESRIMGLPLIVQAQRCCCCCFLQYAFVSRDILLLLKGELKREVLGHWDLSRKTNGRYWTRTNDLHDVNVSAHAYEYVGIVLTLH